MPGPSITPLRGAFNSTAFHVRDPAAWLADARLAELRRHADVLEGQMPDEPQPCFAIVRGTDPRAPFFMGRQPAECVIGERRPDDPGIDDSDGWLALLQRHLAPDEGLVITEWNHPDVPEGMLTWVLTPDDARGYLAAE